VALCGPNLPHGKGQSRQSGSLKSQEAIRTPAGISIVQKGKPEMRQQSKFQTRQRAFTQLVESLLLLVCLLLAARGNAQTNDKDLDAYKIWISGYWWYSQPLGSFDAAGHASGRSFDLQQDFGVGNYSTFTGFVDWRFKRKQHITFDVSPIDNSKSATLTRTITFQGVTYIVGTRVSADLRAFLFAPGYQYDITRRNHGFLGVAAQVNLADTKASLTGAVLVNGQLVTRTASGSVFAPLPVLGLRGRWYPLHNSGLLDFDGSGLAMYFFGYGSFITARGKVDVGLGSHVRLTGGYQMGSRLRINGGSDQIGIRLTQRGAIAGIVGHW
jgi:hypothetical protein